MDMIDKKILTDEDSRPVAVQIAYEDWLEIERRLQLQEKGETNPNSFAELLEKTRGAWKGEDGLEYQMRLRGEWDNR